MKIISILLFVAGLLLLPVLSLMNNAFGLASYVQAEAAVNLTNSGGLEWQLLRSVTQANQYIGFVAFACILCFALSVITSSIHILTRPTNNGAIIDLEDSVETEQETKQETKQEKQ